MRKVFGILFIVLGIVCLPTVIAPDIPGTIGRLLGWSLLSVLPAYLLLRNKKKDDNTKSKQSVLKKVLKITGITIGVILLCLIIFGNVAKLIYSNSFEAQVERANRDCPIPVANGKGKVTAMHVQDGYLTYYISYETNYYNLIETFDDAKAKEAMFMTILCVNGQGNEGGDVLMDKLIEEKLGLKIVINNSSSEIHEFSISPSEIQQLRQRFQLNPHEALYNLLSISIEAEKVNLPIQIEEGMMLTGYELSGENIVYTASVDEKLYSIEDLNANKAALKSSILEEGLNDVESKALLDLCKISHTGLIYRYVGKQSHKKCEVVISSEEIRQIVPTPSSVNIR